MLTLSLQGHMSSEFSFLKKNDDDDFLTFKVMLHLCHEKKVSFETCLIKLKPGLKKKVIFFH